MTARGPAMGNFIVFHPGLLLLEVTLLASDGGTSCSSQPTPAPAMTLPPDSASNDEICLALNIAGRSGTIKTYIPRQKVLV